MIVCRYTLRAESSIAVTLPSATQIDRLIDASDTISAADSYAYSIVFAIAHIRESDLTDDRCIKCSRGTETIDAQRIVHTILLGPLTMIDNAGRQGLQGEVTESIATHYHRTALATEGVDDALQGMCIAIYIIAIELYSIASTLLMTDGKVPATSDTQVCTLRDEVE